MRPLNSEPSKPSSYSWPFSACRFWLPALEKIRPVRVVLSDVTRLVLEKLRSAAYGAGELPARPHAARRRSWSRVGTWKNGSSEITHEAPSLGYTTKSKSSPNAELSSVRSPPVMNTRSRQPSCSCTKKPTVLCSLFPSLAVLVSARPIRFTLLLGSPSALPCSEVKRLAITCEPKVNSELRLRRRS